MSFQHISSVQHAANQEYAHRVNVQNGWYDKPVSFLEAMALLMTEVVEFHDESHTSSLPTGKASAEAASELADCYIRLVDDASRFKTDLSVVVDCYRHTYSRQAAWSLGDVSMNLVRRIRVVIEAYRVEGLPRIGEIGPETRKALAHFYLQLQDTCDDFSVNLQEQFDLKMAVNEARGYRHGNKHA